MGLWVTLPLRQGEQVVLSKTGAVLIRGTELALIGGLLVLTNLRLYHGPLDTRLAGWIVGKGTENAGPPGLAEAVDAVTEWANRARAVDLADIVSIAPIRRSSIRVTTRDGKTREFGIGGPGFAPVWSRKNTPHRDEMLAAVRAALPQPG
jgi:hypothetical protein